MERRKQDDAWGALLRTSARVRASDLIEADPAPSRPLRWGRPLAWSALLLTTAFGFAHLIHSSAPAAAGAGADSTLFSLTNSDRSSNGVGSMSYSGTLQTIGEGGSYGGCGFTVHGRSVDMIQRNYFAHPIAGCGQLVFSIMRAYGVGYRSAGENIGWVSGEGSGGAAAGYINSQFMNSPEHRNNILNGNFDTLGVGSAQSAAGARWTGAGSPGYLDVWMFSEEFAQLGGGAAPPPPPPPTSSGGGGGVPPRNSAAPAAPAQAPATTAPTPTPRPLPTPTPIPAGVLPVSAPAPFAYQYQGLLPGSVESVLESFLIA